VLEADHALLFDAKVELKGLLALSTLIDMYLVLVAVVVTALQSEIGVAGETTTEIVVVTAIEAETAIENAGAQGTTTGGADLEVAGEIVKTEAVVVAYTLGAIGIPGETEVGIGAATEAVIEAEPGVETSSETDGGREARIGITMVITGKGREAKAMKAKEIRRETKITRKAN